MSPDRATIILWAILAVIGAACLFVLYVMAKIIGQMISFRRNEKLPKPQLIHPDLGVLTCDQGIWAGQFNCDGDTLRLYVSGTQEAPAPGLVEASLRVIRDIDRLREIALDFLLADSPQKQLLPESELQIERNAFKLEAVDCLWEHRPHCFCLEFGLEGDPDGAWRVEFENGIPTFTGRDD